MQIMGWSGLIRVDDSTWQMFGSAPGFNFTTILSTEITATRSIFIMSAGPMQVTLTFFSPIEVSSCDLTLPTNVESVDIFYSLRTSFANLFHSLMFTWTRLLQTGDHTPYNSIPTSVVVFLRSS